MLSILGRGAFADVLDSGDGSVIKVYRRTSHSERPVERWDDHEFVTRIVFTLERRAYEAIQKEPELALHTPAYYGVVDARQVALPPSSTGEPYVAGCALRLERLHGKDVKAAFVAEPLQTHVSTALERVNELVPGLDVWDASCFLLPQPREFVLIDFATWEGLGDAQMILDEQGVLDERARAYLRSLPGGG